MTVDQAYKHIRMIVLMTCDAIAGDTPEAEVMVKNVLGHLADSEYGYGFCQGFQYAYQLHEEWENSNGEGRKEAEVGEADQAIASSRFGEGTVEG
jgi:hypothetical protein